MCSERSSEQVFLFYFSEENVYLLCKKLGSMGVAEPTGLDLFVVFISNEGNKVNNLTACFLLLLCKLF